jgi:hypothetical protein
MKIIKGFSVNKEFIYYISVYRLKTLEAYGVEFAVCDSPLSLNIIYNCEPDKVLLDLKVK